jgi:hypothetical protein
MWLQRAFKFPYVHIIISSQHYYSLGTLSACVCFVNKCNYKLRKVTHPSSTVLESKQNSLVKHLKKSDFIN